MNYQRETSNLPILSVFPILTFFDMMWNYNFGCASTWNIIGAGVVGSLVGIIWSEMIFVTNLRQIQYFSILSHAELCSLPSTIKYQCQSRPVEGSEMLSPGPGHSPSYTGDFNDVITITDLQTSLAALQATTEYTTLLKYAQEKLQKYTGLSKNVKNMYTTNTVMRYVSSPKNYFRLSIGKSLMIQWNGIDNEDATNFTNAFTDFYATTAYITLKTQVISYLANNPVDQLTDSNTINIVKQVSIVEIMNAGLNMSS
jgi:hypothetical protein